ncbi:MAG: DUF72 domain-containing protein [Thermomicrobium sp.]|nr:DUF72 domain-containing protein [Thermomicrobium sp.]
MLRVGTSGWSYRHWRGRFYPDELPPWEWFDFYLREFATVELNVTFYRLPPRKRFEDWARRAAARSDFVFAVKAPRSITHLARLADATEELRRFLDAVEGLGAALGPLLFQLPPGFACDLDRLRGFLRQLPTGHPFAFEFRHASWFVPAVAETIAEAGGTVVVAYGGGHPSPEGFVPTGPLVYVRVHSGLYDIGLTDEEIEQFAARLSGWADRPGYVYFNNDTFAHAVADARRLRAALKERGVEVV